MFHFLIVWPRIHSLGCGMYCVSVGSVRCKTELNLLFLYCPDPFCIRLGLFWYRASGPIPQIKSSWTVVSFVVHSVSVMSSLFSSGVMSILCSRFVNCRNPSNHCLGVNIVFPSDALASKFATIIFPSWFRFKKFRFV